MDRRGFTLIELLVAVALLLAISAVAVPVLVTSLDDGGYDATVELTKAALLRARAHAQATGRPVEVVYRADPPRVETRAFDPATGGLEDEELGEMVAEDWAYRLLASGARLTRVAPPEQADALASPLFDSEPPEEEDDALPLRLAVYLPDGSAMLAEPCWIVADSGEAGRLVVNPWSGLPRVGVEAAGDVAVAEEDEEPDAEPDEEPEAEPDAELDEEPAAALGPEGDADAGPGPEDSDDR